MRRNVTIVLVLACVFAACDTHGPQAVDSVLQDSQQVRLRVTPEYSAGKKKPKNAAGVETIDRQAAMETYIALANADLEARGLGIAIARAEWAGGGGHHEAGQTVFANNRTLRLSSQWVAGDPNRNSDGNNLTYVIDESFAFANAFNSAPDINAIPAIDASFDTWNDVRCSKMEVVRLPDTGIGYSALLDTGDDEVDFFYADISTIGFLPGFIFDAILGPGASESVLGVTFTFIWIDENGDPTDINGDGYDDTALAEVWYNDAFIWSTNGSGEDIETVALHENGHALGLGHFGKVFVTNNNNKLHIAPRAVMNAFVLGTLRDPLGTDNGAFCGLYASWPR